MYENKYVLNIISAATVGLWDSCDNVNICDSSKYLSCGSLGSGAVCICKNGFQAIAGAASGCTECCAPTGRYE